MTRDGDKIEWTYGELALIIAIIIILALLAAYTAGKLP